jgi:hypothetical protein
VPTGTEPRENQKVWHLVEDFFEQGLIGKLFVAVGWLAVLIMVSSFVALVGPGIVGLFAP